MGGFGSQAEARRNVALAIEAVAGQLGNTKAVCRKCYVHPAVVEGYLDGSLPQEERALIAFLKAGAKRERPQPRSLAPLLQRSLAARTTARSLREVARSPTHL